MAFTVRQMMNEPIILVTYRRLESTLDETRTEGKKIARLLGEIGDSAYVILDLTGHKNSFQSLYGTIQEILQQGDHKMTNPSRSIVLIGSPALVELHRLQVETGKVMIYAWEAAYDMEEAFEIVRAKFAADEQSQSWIF